MKRILIGLAVAGLLAACSNDNTGDSPPEKVAAAVYRAGGAKSITVMTMINNRTGSGGHTALLVKGSQSVIFDPAGSFRDPRITERADVIYGASPGLVKAYKSAHARSTFHVVSQEIPVSPAQAELILKKVLANGSVSAAFCANATSTMLSTVPGFESLQTTFYPAKFMAQVAQLPGVKTTKLYENDSGEQVDVNGAVGTLKTQ